MRRPSVRAERQEAQGRLSILEATDVCWRKTRGNIAARLRRSLCPRIENSPIGRRVQIRQATLFDGLRPPHSPPFWESKNCGADKKRGEKRRV
jgi:hypothetical protein